jgi:hypothetical protein
MQVTRFDYQSEPSFEDDPDVVEYGGELILAAGFTSGGAPFGLTVEEHREMTACGAPDRRPVLGDRGPGRRAFLRGRARRSRTSLAVSLLHEWSSLSRRRGERIRIISARRASPNQRKRYEKTR